MAGKGIGALAAAAAVGGTIFEYGALALEPTPFPLYYALKKHLWIKGYTLFEVVGDPEAFAAAKKYVFDHLESGAFQPKIARTFPFREVVQAQEFMESNVQVGKIVVVV